MWASLQLTVARTVKADPKQLTEATQTKTAVTDANSAWGSIFMSVTGTLAAAAVAGAVATVALIDFAEIVFSGLIQNMPLTSLTQQQIRNALAKAGLREAHNAHFISRLIARGPSVGIRTLNDLARALRGGVAQAGAQEGTIDVLILNGTAVLVFNKLGELVTFLVGVNR